MLSQAGVAPKMKKLKDKSAKEESADVAVAEKDKAQLPFAPRPGGKSHGNTFKRVNLSDIAVHHRLFLSPDEKAALVRQQLSTPVVQPGAGPRRGSAHITSAMDSTLRQGKGHAGVATVKRYDSNTGAAMSNENMPNPDGSKNAGAFHQVLLGRVLCKDRLIKIVSSYITHTLGDGFRTNMLPAVGDVYVSFPFACALELATLSRTQPRLRRDLPISAYRHRDLPQVLESGLHDTHHSPALARHRPDGAAAPFRGIAELLRPNPFRISRQGAGSCRSAPFGGCKLARPLGNPPELPVLDQLAAYCQCCAGGATDVWEARRYAGDGQALQAVDDDATDRRLPVGAHVVVR